MSLRTALAALPDDRSTAYAVHEIVACFAAHPREPLTARRVSRSTGLEPDRVQPVLEALVRGVVIDCDGDPELEPCRFEPDSVLSLEVQRFLRSGGVEANRMQTSVDRFRSRLGH